MLLTPPGSAAIAVVRLAGPNVGAFLERHFSKRPVADRCVHGDLTDDGQVIDDVVVVFLANPPRVDLNLHGGPWVVRSVLSLAAREGFEVIESLPIPLPAEATEGETPFEREIFASLPLATSERALRTLLAQQEAWSRVPQLSTAEQAAMAADESLWWLLHPPRVAIAGPPNVGKSTLANRLFAQERSITADLPGTTRDWVGALANLDGFVVTLVDTPGLRQTPDAIEAAAIDHAGAQLAGADLVVLVLDGSLPLDDASEIIERFPRAMRVLNKSDLPAAFDPGSALRVSARLGDGIDALRSAISAQFRLDARPGEPKWWTPEQRSRLAGGPGRPLPPSPANPV